MGIYALLMKLISFVTLHVYIYECKWVRKNASQYLYDSPKDYQKNLNIY